MSKKLLDGVRVLDLTNVLSGPFATLHLALLGAEVVKIENPKNGDLARALGNVPKLSRQLMGNTYLAQNSNKLSVTLNLKTERGIEAFRRLLPTADVLVENFRPGVMKRLGISYEDLAADCPRLVYCAISGFGQTGPDADKPAYDQIIQGLSGTMDVNGDERLNPLRCGFPVCDTAGGLTAAFAVMAALYHRERTGEGQMVDVALLDSIMPMLGWVVANLLIGGQPPVPLGNDNFTAAPSGTFATKDGHVNIAANKQEQWEAVTEVLGVPELKGDPRFSEREARKRNRELLTLVLEERLIKRTTSEWVDALNARDVPSGAILSLAEALSQPQVVHRGILRTVKAPGIGDLPLLNLAALFSKTPAGIDSPPPRLSEHTDAILGGVGYSAAELASMRNDGII